MAQEACNRRDLLRTLRNLNQVNVKYQAPLIIKMYGELNKVKMTNENRYILCNFIDQNSDLMNMQEDIYITNNQKSLDQLFLLAFNKAKQYNLLGALYDEYSNSINAISMKKEYK